VKDRNREKADRAIKAGKVTARFGTTIREIRDDVVVLETEGGSEIVPNDYVVVRIGGDPPYAFLERLGVRIVQKDLPMPAAPAQAG